MAPLVTHLIIGERVFANIERLPHTPSTYGSFLLGCTLVDANSFFDIDRRQTHFVGRLDEDGQDAFQRSCDHFLDQLDALLIRPWSTLSETEQAFVAGYLCHLAADEPWKEFAWNLLQSLGISSWNDYPVPGDVILTAFSALSSQMLIDRLAVAWALKSAVVPNVLVHVPHTVFLKTREIIQGHLLNGSAIESYIAMLEHAGEPDAEIQATRQRHDRFWDKAMAFIRDTGGLQPYIEKAVERSVEILPQLWR